MREKDLMRELWSSCGGWAVRGGVAAGATGAVAVHLTSASPGQMTALTEWFLNRPMVFGLFYLALGLGCLNFALASPRWKYEGDRARRWTDYVLASYCGMAGALLGWTASICGWAAAMDSRLALPVVGIVLMVSAMIAVPVFCHVAARLTVASLYSRMFVEPWRVRTARAVGWSMFVLAGFGAYHDMFVRVATHQ
jgi:hypothetical protein